MKSHTPTSRKSPFAINRKSNIQSTSSFVVCNENSFLTSNKLGNTCLLTKSRPMIEFEGRLLDASTTLRHKDSALMDSKNSPKRLEFEMRKKDKTISVLQKELDHKQTLVARLEAQKESMGDAFAMMQSEMLQALNVNQELVKENLQLKRQMSQKVSEAGRADKQISELKSNLQIYLSLDPRLKQLQELQDNLIEQNSTLKDQKDKYKQRVGNLLKRMKEGRKIDIKQVSQLLEHI